MIVFLQVTEQVKEHRFSAAAIKNVAMLVVRIKLGVEEMAEQFFAEGFEQIILGLEMGIEGGSADICFFDDLAHGDVVIIRSGKEFRKGMKDRFSGFSLSPIHSVSPYIFYDLFRNESLHDIVCCIDCME